MYLKLCVGFSVSGSASFLLNFIFLFNKKHGLLTLKRRNSFQNKKNPRPLTFKIQQTARCGAPHKLA